MLGRVIEEYEKHHPSVTGSEVRAALGMAGRSSKAATPAAALVVGFVGLLLAGGFVFMAANGGSLPANGISEVGVVIVLVSILGIAFVLKRLAGK